MVDWNSRLVVKFTPDGGDEELIQPIDNFNPKLDMPHDVIDSIDAENIGFESKSRRFSFDFTSKGLNVNVMRKMIYSAVQQGTFSIGLGQAADDTLDQWVFNELAFENCRFTNVSPSDVTNDGGAPTMSFSGICLDVFITTDDGTIMPKHTGGAGGTIA